MPVTIVVGGQWGDEGKGKIVDALSAGFRAVVRYQGGPNAGHTVVRDDRRLVLHQLPTGILQADVHCFLAPGVVLDPWALRQEIDELHSAGFNSEMLVISPACHVIMPWHRDLDGCQEDRAGGGAIGTTRRGIGPCYIDKTARRGIRFADFVDEERLRHRIEAHRESIDAQLMQAGKPVLDVEALLEECRPLMRELIDYLGDSARPVRNMLEAGEAVLMEGAQGTLLDVDWGTYPFVTSSNPLAGGACTGGGVSPMTVERVIGIFKTYQTRVGNGPFPSEFQDEAFHDEFRQRAGEFGATTGRNRRCGWFDLVAARHSARINGLTDLVFTKLDILSGLPDIQVCVGYRVGGEVLEDFPEDSALLEGPVEAVFRTLPGWEGDLSRASSLEELPKNARAYLDFLSAEMGCRIGWVSTGPGSDQVIRCP